MEDLLIEALSGFDFPVLRQGSLLPDEPYPNNFFTFWNDSTTTISHYDNVKKAVEWLYSINFYSVDPLKVAEVLAGIGEKLESKGFIVAGAGYDVHSDEQTHTGRGIEVLFRQDL